jgi:omega-6 fatty acid desaturase (delta-12 desaturase)
VSLVFPLLTSLFTHLPGLWVIGHECGHRGFADSELINDAVGLVVHSFLLVPYFAWQISHRRHHSNTGSVEHDEVFVPVLATQEQVEKKQKQLAGDHHEEEGFIAQTTSTLHRMFYIVVMLTLGWPAYLFMNITGNRSYDPMAWVNHFAPASPIFTNGLATDAFNQKLILISDVALFAVFAVFYKLVAMTSFTYFVYIYFIPYLIVNFWLVLITYLQHTDLNLPHYTDGEWDWLRGALATIDRDYGFINIVLHHITDTHVVHHLFSPMPHYHAEEATAAVKSLLGPYYRYDSTPIATALWNSFRDCTELHPDEQGRKGVHWFLPK